MAARRLGRNRFGDKGHFRRNQRKAWGRLESLEDRRLLVLGAFEIPPLVAPGEGFDGVVALDFSNSSTASDLSSGCTGALLNTGMHVLTAAHCVTDGAGVRDVDDLQVVFEMSEQNYVFDVDLTQAGVLGIPAAYDGNLGNGADVAIIELPALGPFPAERYDIFRGNGELGDIISLVGYGNTGTGTNGQIDGGIAEKRIGYNEIGDIDNLANGDVIRYDFDDGSGGNNTLGDSLGLGGTEALTGTGDSGSPWIMDSRFIAGVTSFGGLSFGATDNGTRISDFTGFIDNVLDADSDIVLDMNLQPAGNDGVADTITARLDPVDASRMQLLINGEIVWSDLLANVDSLTLDGSGDDDSFVLDGDFEVDVNVNGGLGFDSLEIIGDGVDTAIYDPSSTTTGDGRITVGIDIVDFTGLEPVTVSNLAAFQLTTPNAADVITVDAPQLGRTRVSGTSDNIPFESVTFFDVDSFTIDAATNDNNAPDTFVIETPLTATGLSSFAVNTGGGNDVLTAGADFSLAGNPDTFTWDAGDGSDTLNVSGDADFTLTDASLSAAGSAGAGTLGLNSTVEQVNLVAGDSNNTIDASGFTVGTVTIDGGAGSDQLTGSSGADRIHGGAGNDTITAGLGNDFIYGEADSDTIIWNNGDGSDLMEGGTGNDHVIVNGADGNAASENYTIEANGARTELRRNNLILFSLDIGQVEELSLNTGDSSDDAEVVTVNSLVGTEVAVLNLSVGPDTNNSFVLNGNDSAEAIAIGPNEQITGLGPVINSISAVGGIFGDSITINAGGGDDSITVSQAVNVDLILNGGAGNDRIDASVQTSAIDLTINGDAGNDTLLGSPVSDIINGGSGDDTITGNGGTDTIDGGTGADTIHVAGSAGNDNIALSQNANGDLVVVVNGATTTYTDAGAVGIDGTNVEGIVVDGLAGDDTLNVDVGTGDLINVPITFNGGAGEDLLQVFGAPATTVAETEYTPGAIVTDGRLVYDTDTDRSNGVAMTIDFTGLEPVVDLVAAGNLIVNGTNADNAINYSIGPNSGADAPFNGDQTGLVSVDGFETIEFANKTLLTLNGSAGSDAINLNYQNFPTSLAPTGLGSGLAAGIPAILVNGGDPTDNDQLTYNNIANVGDFTLVRPTAQGVGNIVPGTAGNQPTVGYNGIEALELVGQLSDTAGATGDTFGIAGTAGNDTFEFVPGTTADSGSFSGIMDSNNASGAGAFPLPAITYQSMTVTGSTLLRINGDVANQGGADTVVLNGTDVNDVFTVTNRLVTLASSAWGAGSPAINLGSIAANSTTSIVVNALVGDDTINLNNANSGSVNYDFNGGNPDSGSDVLNLVDPANITGVAVPQSINIQVDPTNSSEQDIIGYGTPAAIDVTGIELITYTGITNPGTGARDDNLFLNLQEDDRLHVDSQSPATTARVTSSSFPEIHFTRLNTFFVNGLSASSAGVHEVEFVTQNLDPTTAYNFQGNNQDILTITGADTLPDAYTVTNPPGIVAGSTVSVVDTNSGVTVTTGSVSGPFTPGEVRLNTRAGDDTVNVNVGASDLIETRIVYDGGTGGDVLNVIGTPATPVINEVYTVGSDPTSGRIDYGTSVAGADLTGATLAGSMQIEFTNLQPVVSTVPVSADLIINANNAHNMITYTSGPNVGGVAANTGLVAVDDFETIEFANKTVLTLNALAGNDTIILDHTGPAVAPTGLTFIVANGGLGEDVIDGSSSTNTTPMLLFGGSGNDTLAGGLGGDVLYGGVGNDTLVHSPGNDSFDGGDNGTVAAAFPAIPAGTNIPAATPDPITATSGFDTILIRGTSLNDIITATQNAPVGGVGGVYVLAVQNTSGGAPLPVASTDLIHQVNPALAPGNIAARPSIEEVRIEAGLGNDEIVVAHADAYVDATGTGAAPVPNTTNGISAQMLRFDVRGDAPNSSDRLTVRDLGNGDLILLRQAVDERSGRVTIAPAVNTTTAAGFLGDVVYTGIENVDITPVNPLNGGTGSDGLGQVVVFDSDPFEFNDNILTATDLGDFNLVTRQPNIDPAHNPALGFNNGDEDWYAFTPTQNGTFQVNTLFTAIPNAQPAIPGARPGLPGNGVLASGLYTSIGAATVPLVVGSPLADAGGTVIGTQLQFAGVANTTYYLRVTGGPLPGAAVSASPAINTYDIALDTAPVQIDNLGPQVFDPDGPNFPGQAVQIVGSPTFNLFANKPANAAAGPTPIVNGLTINFRDPITSTQVGTAPGATLGALDPQTALNPGNYRLVGDATGIVPISNVSFALPQNVVPGAVVAGPTGIANAPGRFSAGVAGLSNVNGFYVGQTVQFTSGALNNQFRTVTGYLGASRTFTFDAPFTAAPAVGDTFVVAPYVISPVNVLGTATVLGIPNAAANPTSTVITLGVGGVPGAGLSTTAGDYVGQAIQHFPAGATIPTAGEIRTITAYNGAGVFTVEGGVAANGFNNVPTVGSTVNIVGTPATATSTIFAATVNNSFVGGAGLPAVSGALTGQALQFTSGALAGQARVITGYTIGTIGGVNRPIFSFENGFTGVPATGDTFSVVPAVASPLTNAVVSVFGNRFSGGLGGVTGSGLDPASQAYLGQVLQFTSGPLAGQAQVITDYANNIFAFEQPFGGAPAAGNTFVIYPINTAAVTISFPSALADDRYTLTLDDSIRDYAGNQLDGESNASQPVGVPTFPSGDGFSGGDFVGRFTVDSRPEVAVWSGASVHVDTNGNYRWDPFNQDAIHRDVTYNLGFVSDNIIAGNFAAIGGVPNGYDKVGAYGRLGNGTFRWLIDLTDNGVPVTFANTTAINGTPVAGNFAPGNPGDEVGIFNGTTWFLDGNGNYDVSPGTVGNAADVTINSALRGYPFVVDIDADGLDDLATYNENFNRFEFDLAANGFGNAAVDRVIIFDVSGVTEKPVAADMDGDGVDDIGVFVPHRTGASPQEFGEWYFFVSGNGTSLLNRVPTGGVNTNTSTIAWTPTPFGSDLFIEYGDEFALPLVGNFDPPIEGSPAIAAPVPSIRGTYSNPIDKYDVNASGNVTLTDALEIVSRIRREGTQQISFSTYAGNQSAPYFDVSQDGSISLSDAIEVIGKLRHDLAAEGEGEGEPAAPVGNGGSSGKASSAANRSSEKVASATDSDVNSGARENALDLLMASYGIDAPKDDSISSQSLDKGEDIEEVLELIVE